MAQTLVVSDLHLGAGAKHLLGEGTAALDALCAHVQATAPGRLILLGDTIEGRHGRLRDALDGATPVLAALGEALGDREVVLVPGNHDHALIAPWLDARLQRRAAQTPLRLDERAGPRASPAIARIAKALGPATLEVRYPGVWLREDVYATHGHYLDRFMTVPTVERLAAGAMEKIMGTVPEHGATPDDFEAALAPLYAWMHVVAQSAGSDWQARGQSTSASTWESLTATGRRPLKVRAARRAWPLAIAALNGMGLGPVRPRLTGGELRRSGLRAIDDVVRRLGIDAEHVVFGHTHRAGPLPGDHAHEWQTATGARLHNTGSWTGDATFAADADPANPYAGGRVVELDAGGPPRLVRVYSR